MYNFNAYAIPNFIVSAWIFIVGLILFLKRRETLAYLAYFGAVGWIFGCGMAYLATTYGVAKLWLKLVFVSIILIAPTFFHFVSIFLEITDKEKKFILFNYLISFLFVGFTIFSDLLIYPEKHWWGYYPKAGSFIHPIFLLWFGIVYFRGLYNLYLPLRQKDISPLKSLQIKYLVWTYIFAIFGGIDFIPDYGVEFYPFGYFFTGIGVTITAYAILRYRLLDINIALTRAGIFAIVYFPIVFLPFWIAPKFIHTNLWWIPIVLMGILATLGIFIYNNLRKRAEDRILREERHAHELLRQASKGMVRYRNMKELLGLINHITSKTLKLDNAAVFLVEENSGNFNLAAVRLKSKYHYLTSLNNQDVLIQKLFTLEEPLVYEEVKLKAQELKDKPDNPIHDIESQMQKLSAAVIVPALSKGRLLAFLVLGEKKSKRMYSPDDLATLWALSYQAALAIENALLYEKEKTWLSEQSRRQALADMAPGASHQFNNRLAAISCCADTLKDILEFDAEKLSKEELVAEIRKGLQKINGEVGKGSQITDAILQKAKVKLDFDQVDIIKVIQNAINLTKLRRTRSSLEGAQELEFIFNYPQNLPLLNLCEGPMQDVFENLFNNAMDAIVIKNTRKIVPEGYQGKISINVAQQGEDIIITIEDNGIGVEEQNLKKLFVPYFTTKSTAEKGVHGGSGLGLCVMRDFVEQHGGTIRVESEYTKWTKFTITLPIHFKPH